MKKRGFGSSLKTGTTEADVADLVEFAINENEPTLKTKRGVGSTIKIKIGGRQWKITVRPARRPNKRKAA